MFLAVSNLYTEISGIMLRPTKKAIVFSRLISTLQYVEFSIITKF